MRIRIGLGKNEEALISVNLAQKLDPNFPGVYDLKCTIFSHLGRINDALEALEQAIRLNPDNVEDYNQVKVALESLRKPTRWIQLALPPRGELLALPEIAESLSLRQVKEEVKIDPYDTQTMEH